MRGTDRYVAPWSATFVDDLALGRPLLVLQRALRLVVWLRTRRWLPVGRIRPGVTIVIVNWNSGTMLVDVLDAIDRYTPKGTDVVVMDNGSSDESHDLLRTWAAAGRIRVVFLPANLNHGPAMDLGIGLVHTDTVVALDVDAFPVRADWLAALIRPLDEGARVVGARSARGYIHPCCLAMRTADFFAGRHTFTVHAIADESLPVLDDDWPVDLDGATIRWDTAESISRREGEANIAALPRTSYRGPLQLGSVFGDVVFHNGASTRVRGGETIDGLTAADVTDSWDEAVHRWVRSPRPTGPRSTP